MIPDSVPLISAAAVKAALARPATAPASSAVTDARGQPANSVELQVSNSQRQPEGFRLTLTSAQGQQLQVLSEHDLPAGSRLILQLPDADKPSGKPLQVLSISLPAAPGTAPATPLAGGTATVAEALTQVLNRFIAARLGLAAESQPARPAAPAADLYARPAASSPASNSSPAMNTASARAELLNLLQQLASPGSANTAPRPLNSQSSTAATNPITTATMPGQPMPAAVQRVLQNWLQTLPAPAQLSQPAGLQQAIQNSGLSYEQRLFSALSNPPAGAGQGNTTEASNLFRQLWQRAAALAQPNPATGAAANTAAGAAASPATTNSATSNVAALLQAVQQKLEQPGQPAAATSSSATATSPATPGLLASLFSSDHKAVLGKALMIWAQQLHQHSGSDSPPPRTLPMLPPADMPDTFRLLQAALAQTETEQVQRLQQGDNWQLQIPLFYRDGEIPREVQLHLHKDSDPGDAEGKRKAVRWRLRLHFDLQQLGPLDIDIELQYPALSATFWSQQAPTLTQLNRELQPLRQRLQQLGVEVQELQVRHGQLPAPERNRISQRLVDIHS